MAKLLGKPLEPQWKKIFTKRVSKTGVSESLRKFDDATCFKKLQAKSYHRDQVDFKDLVAFWSQLEGLGKFLKTLKSPKMTPWTQQETTFLEDLKKDINTELLFWKGTNIKDDPRGKNKGETEEKEEEETEGSEKLTSPKGNPEAKKLSVTVNEAIVALGKISTPDQFQNGTLQDLVRKLMKAGDFKNQGVSMDNLAKLNSLCLVKSNLEKINTENLGQIKELAAKRIGQLKEELAKI